ncbi:MAG: hypothetical protein LLG05_18585 [Porphyromonadaceae bacterium]|nr:hypothetical protein [Porphyromonadaceae bacterium]
MKTNILYVFLMLLLVTAFAGGCSDDETEPFRFYEEAYEVPVHGTRYIGVKSGSGDYTIQVENTGILSASEDDGWSSSEGTILVRGLLTGEATLTVTDNRTNETQDLHIKVINNYEVISISTFENNHPVFSKTPFLFLINNQERDVYFADMEGEKSITENGIQVKGKGSYSFTMEDSQPCLTLTYATDENGQLTDDASTSPTPHKFIITKSSEFVLHRLDENLNLGWDTPSGSYSAEQMSAVIEMEEEETGYQNTGSFDTYKNVTIPKGVLN